MPVSSRKKVLALAVLSLLVGHAVQAQEDEYFKGKTITIVVGGNAGDGYDVYARLLARHWGKHIPGAPKFVVQNMPGAGTLVAANYMYEKADNDGTVVGTVGGGTATAQLFKTKNIRFDPRRFVWIGSLNSEVGIVLAWHTQPFKSVKDLMEKEMVVGGGGPTSGNVIFPIVLNRVIGTKFKVVAGYSGTGAIALAIERGELQGTASYHYSSMITSRPDWIEKKLITPLIQLAMFKHPVFPDVPNILDLAKTEEQRQVLDLVFARQQMGRPFLLPPGTKPEIAKILRAAFNAVVQDKEFLEEAQKARIDLTKPMTGEEIHALIDTLYGYPPRVVETAIAASDTAEFGKGAKE
ncbi:MAG TPA: tripartite tricarboxylate transporter substrate-binding protein [Hyphomicrobiaceae bacterium]|nr:tripartite tricarboxylate transporter substrate-binding protein [Hyphomicrobiaceae bacterium]